MAYGNNDRERQDQARGVECDAIRALFDKEFPRSMWDNEVDRLNGLAEYTMEYFSS